MDQIDYTQHPLWEAQVDLERRMMTMGADRFRDRVISAERNGTLSEIGPVKGLLRDAVPLVAADLKQWCKSFANTRGPKPVALQYIQPADKLVLAAITVRTLLGRLGQAKGYSKLTALALQVGGAVEHELQVRAWEEKEPKLFWAEQKRMDRLGSTERHRERANITAFNDLLSRGLFDEGWDSWTADTKLRVGIAMLDSTIRATGWFEVIADPSHQKRTKYDRPPLVLATKPALTEWLGDRLEKAEASSAHFWPCLVPPKPWSSSKDGGYHTAYVSAPHLIRFKASQAEQQKGAGLEYDALEMPNVYAAINHTQAVGWAINRRVYGVMWEAWCKDMGIAGLPVLRDRELPPRPADIETNQEAKKKWKREAASVYNANIRRRGSVLQASSILLLASEFKDYDTFYYPHMLDFRGRMYPIPSGLQPQGHDMARGLLRFAEGREITEGNEGAEWLAIALSAHWGYDKASFSERLDWAHDREALWRSIAADPLGDLTWAKEADKPWQALAAIFEWVSYLDTGPGFVSHLPVSVDGTCNGIQHLSAMTRDQGAGEQVNLTPGERPRDIYKYVAEDLQERLQRQVKKGGIDGERAAYWLRVTGGVIPRTLTKRQVMVLPYGGTRDSYFEYTRAWLNEHDPLPSDASEEERKERSKRLSLCVTLMWDAVNDRVKGAMAVMKWLQEAARHATKGNQPIFWEMPSGFIVRHFYGQFRQQQVKTLLDGRRVDLRLTSRTANLDVRQQLRGIAPNFVHSADAAALVLTVNALKEAGVNALTAVHDAYGTHAADMWTLHRIARESFVEVHQSDVLASFRRAVVAVVVDALVSQGLPVDQALEKAEETIPPPPEAGDLNLADVLASDYFFA